MANEMAGLMENEDRNRWCILRTAGPSTLSLARSLAAAGIAAWTPLERIARRAPRGKAKERLTVALTPTYVFVRERHLAELRAMERAEISGHPRFSIFRHYHETVFVRHAALHALRAREQASYVASLPTSGKFYAKGRGKPFAPGDSITLKEGALAGIPCVVESSDERVTHFTLTLFGRETGMKIETSELRADGVATVASAA